MVNPQMQANGYTTDDSALKMGGAAKNLLNGLRAALGSVQAGVFCVLSPGNTAAGTAPLSNVITSAVVDAVPDVQHRRTNRLVRREGGSWIVQDSG
jgi:hypothetical protein